MKTKSAVLYEMEKPQVGEVLVELSGAGLCHSDLNATDENFPEHIKELTDGGPHYAIEAVGSEKAQTQAYLSICKGGTMVTDCCSADLFPWKISTSPSMSPPRQRSFDKS